MKLVMPMLFTVHISQENKGDKSVELDKRLCGIR